MEEKKYSKLLLAGSKENIVKVASALYQWFSEGHSQWKEELQTVLDHPGGSVGQDQQIFELMHKLKVCNKYFTAPLEIVLLSEPHTQPDLEAYEGLITIVDDRESKSNSWLISHTTDSLQLRITLINSQASFDLDNHLETLDCYVETLVEDLENLKDYTQVEKKISSLVGEDSQGMERIIEAINETMWTYHHKDEKSGHKVEEYKLVDDDELIHNNAADKEQPNNDSNQKEEASFNKKNKVIEGEEQEFDEELMDQEMKIFEEIMAFKSMSGSISQDQKKAMADKLFSKLANMYGDDM